MLCVSGGSSDGWSGHGRPTAGMRATSQIRRNGPVFQKSRHRRQIEETSGGALEVLREVEVGVLTRHHQPRENLMNTTPTTPTEAVTAALAAHPESSAAELAEAAGIGGSTASKYLADLERDGVAVRRPGGHEGARRRGRPDRAGHRTRHRRRNRGRPDYPRRRKRASAPQGRAVHARARLPEGSQRRRDRAECDRQGARSILRCGRECVPTPRSIGQPPPRERLATALPDRRRMIGASAPRLVSQLRGR